MINMEDPQFEKLLGYLQTQEHFVFLDTNRQDHENKESFLFVAPIERAQCRVGDDLDGYLVRLQKYLDEGYYLAGWIGYEFGSIYGANVGQDRVSGESNDTLLADLGVFFKPHRFRHDTGENNFPSFDNYNLSDNKYKITDIAPNMTMDEFVSALEQVRDYIAAGDTYQVNYTMKLGFSFEGSVERWYQTLRRNQSVPYGAYIRNGNERILSLSPELFFRKRGNAVISKPMKGTMLRGFTNEEERNNATFLCNDSKNRSENVMIVDLLRNDLSKLMFRLNNSEVGVDSLFDVESYESLLQMTSTVRATCPESEATRLRVADLFQALFPCGSITGAPKIRTMEIIHELEKSRRGVYTGAIGYISPDGDAVFSVPIRTVHLRGARGEMGVGAGITYDSDPVEEWHESLLKGRFLTHSEPEYYLFETMLWQPDSGYLLLDEHLERLSESASFFKFRFAREKVVQKLQETGERLRATTRVRLVLFKDGRLSVAAQDGAPPGTLELPACPRPTADFDDGELPRVGLDSSGRDWPGGPWCYHKTSMRKRYDAAFSVAKEKGLFDIIVCNKDGDVAEGCITNVVIYKDGRYLTPPVASGLLHGTMRRHLLTKHGDSLVETRLTPADLANAEAIFLCNSVRGVVQVALEA